MTAPPAAATEIRIENPATGEPVGRVPVASRADVAAAVARARAAQPAWEARGVGPRKRLLIRFHDLLFERRDEILDTIQRESGKTRREAFGELLTVAGTARYYIARGERFLAAEDRPGALRLVTGARLLHKPHGVVGLITPWNYPFILSIADALPALLAGNAVVVKPSELTPLSAEMGRAVLLEAGLESDLFQLVHGSGEIGAALIAGVDYVGFTGSVATGRKIAAAAAARLIPSSLELGGKNPMLVLDGAPLEAAVDGLIGGAFYNSGQTCIAVERAYIERPLFDRFVALATQRTEALKLGWSLDWDVDLGCLISRAHADKVMTHVADAAARGATVVTGGRRREDLGPTFVAPTLLTGVEESMEVCREETFGPVVSLYPVDSVDEAVARANDSEYGLNASVWSRDDRTSMAVAERLATGSVGINATLLIYASFDVPMGGVKQSGLGRRHGRAGILRFTRSSSIVRSVTRGGGYEALITKVTSEGRARALARAFELLRHIPGLR